MSHRRTRHPTHEEILLWRHVMREVAPMRPTEFAIDQANDNEIQPAAPKARPQPAAPLPKATTKLGELEPGKLVDVDKGTAGRLAKGQMAIEGRLDLHGLTESEAHGALNRFLAMSRALGRRCVLVITGKGAEGKGVLRTALPRWLNTPDMRPLVLAVSQAQPKDGGTGAFYVLLKRNRGGGA
ncbi:MAG: DNA mismatch repair protein MutS [Rhodospirillales bacterium]|nr:MAG: DNA mismatch repair protein MutS [Rhodospirillales bacterium]